MRVEVDYSFFSEEPYIQPLKRAVWANLIHQVIKVPGWDIVQDETGESMKDLGSLLMEHYQLQSYDYWDPYPSYYYRFNYVLNYAFSTWFRKAYSPDPATYSWAVEYPGYTYRCLDGMMSSVNEVYTKEAVEAVGVGFVPMIKFFMMSDPGDYAYYRSLYDTIEDHEPVMEAFESTLTSPWDEWLPDFYTAYLTNQIYPDLWGSNLASVAFDSWDVGNPDLEFHTTLTLSDLSMEAYEIDLSHATFNESAALYLSISSDEVNDQLLDLVALAWNGTSAEYIGKGNEWIIEGIKEELVDLGYTHLIILAVNSSHALNYLGETEVYVDMEVRQVPTWSTVSVDVDVNAWVDGQYLPDENYQWWHAEGEISGTEFNFPIDFTFGSDGYYSHTVGHIEGTFNENYTTIQSLRAELTYYNYVNYVLNSTTYREVHATGPIPVIEGYPGSFFTWGEETCDKIDLLIYTYTGPGGPDQLTDWDCDVTSEIYVGFN